MLYCVRLRGDLTQIAASFPGFDTEGHRGVVAIRGDFDDAGLHGVLERARVLGYEIVDVYRTCHDDAGADATVSGQRGFEIRILGSLGPASRNAFSGFHVEVQPMCTVISGRLSQEQLHLILDRVRALTLELVDVRRVPEETMPSDADSWKHDPETNDTTTDG